MSKLILGKKSNAAIKPQTTLAEKAAGFKFKLPTAKRSGEAAATDKPTSSETVGDVQPEKRSSGLQLGSKANNANVNAVQETSKSNVQTETAHQPNSSVNNIPKMSDDKYEVVADSSDSFSEESGDKFQQQLATLQQAIDGTGDLKDGMQNILIFLDDNPQYKGNISPRDVSVFVAACRKVAGITVTEKKTRATKRKTSATLDADIMADLADLDLDLGI